MRSFFPHTSPKAHNEDAITVFVDAFDQVGQLQKSYGTIAVLSASNAASDGRRIQGTVAPHPESECSG
jgi:hypothetical protein